MSEASRQALSKASQMRMLKNAVLQRRAADKVIDAFLDAVGDDVHDVSRAIQVDNERYNQERSGGPTSDGETPSSGPATQEQCSRSQKERLLQLAWESPAVLGLDPSIEEETDLISGLLQALTQQRSLARQSGTVRIDTVVADRSLSQLLSLVGHMVRREHTVRERVQHLLDQLIPVEVSIRDELAAVISAVRKDSTTLGSVSLPAFDTLARMVNDIELVAFDESVGDLPLVQPAKEFEYVPPTDSLSEDD